MNFLTADGGKFAHPLHHLGKSAKDLPLIAIDSFRHMYLFPDAQQMDVPGKVKKFIADLHSGKLHREYHVRTFFSNSFAAVHGEFLRYGIFIQTRFVTFCK